MKSTARFDEFSTVDWMEDSARERTRQNKRLATEMSSAAGTLSNRLCALYDSLVSWLVLLVVGILIGVNTAFISIVTEWLSGLKLGMCANGWWLNQKFCCWEEPDSGCARWRGWDHAAFGTDLGFVRWLSYVFLGTAMATCCAYLVKQYAPLAAGSGLPEIKAILGGFVIKGFMGGWTLLMKSVGLALAVASGLSVGKEGPAVHMGCCVGNVVSRNFAKYRRSAARQREVVSAAAAAGVAVAFGAPIGGVLFSLEDLSSRFPRKTLWRSFFCALIATVSLQAMNPFWTGKLVMFQTTYDRDWRFFETVFFVVIGAFGGVYGGLCIRFNLRVAALRKRYLANRVVQEVAVLAAVTTAVAYANRFTKQDMGELLGMLLQECKDSSGVLCAPDRANEAIWALLWATLIRICGTVLAYGCRVPCGIFVPSMAIGATFGRMLGAIAQEMHRAYPKWSLFSQCLPDTPCITPATYAFLGAAAAMCGVTKVTVAVVVIMYELTGALNFIVPTMIVVMVARIIGDAIVDGGISEQLILLNGLPFLDEGEIEQINEISEASMHVSVAAIMRSVDDVFVLPAVGLSLDELSAILADSARQGIRGFPVVDNLHDMRVIGYVLREGIVRALDTVHAGCDLERDRELPVVFGAGSLEEFRQRAPVNLTELVSTSPVTVRPQLSAETAVEIFCKLGPRVILVTGEDGGYLMGLLTRKDVLRQLRAIHNNSDI
ncbi:glycerol ethanol, ferric requiring protein [Coemansia erecta]|uniref:Chloride channel protein n=1 Tax=Coemansia asiatica TaxID=1052880 RepID=A0A9W8CJM3_9FUNG|nr:glycerol ethanol, ferric requiring protein [Coemansia asiatica]KAJ2857680.1 glycerol ethanol, ferric requiring protein [Coemansia erecta]KAJ2881641.1 glycerol ethanol, ferric requiring protein [Coemansia asiatica]